MDESLASLTTNFSVITVVNWAIYQVLKKIPTTNQQRIQQQINNKWTTNQQQINTNKNVNNGENVKNGENEKKVTAFDF
ncbi:hypothetical protein ACVQ9Z_15365 [Staphylococcus aureus]